MEYGYRYFSLGMMVLLISFLGFVLENMWLAVTKGYIDNRNMRLPFLLGYGVLVVGMYLLLGTSRDVVLMGRWRLEGDSRWFYYLASAVIVSVGEILLGSFVERRFGFEYWNYEWIPYHFTKYTSLPTSLGFAAIITLFMEHIFPAAMRLLSQWDSVPVQLLSAALLLLCLLDFVVSFQTMYRTHGLNERWRVERVQKGNVCEIEIQHSGSV